ncbi:MAG TPA: L-histidine N(alpha)-methyltransferase [Thermoanaerobaculia bacterium]|nr:L-histidine N(alpha)-methyltransferase [Thermoanaerobaculia bacterium]
MIRESISLTEQRLRVLAPPMAAAAPTFADDVRRGLTTTPKVLYPRYFYDRLGSLLFEAICELPEYYPTRAETEIFERHAAEIVQEIDGRVRLVELGSGDGRKTRLLIEALVACQGRLEYLPIDVSRSALEQSAERLLQVFPELSVTAFVADYQAGLRAIRGELVPSGLRTLALFLGSTIGNLDPADRVELLRGIRGVLRPGDSLLLGVDLRKSPDILLPAYDDALGVTAAFNLNVLLRVNQELGGGFDLAAFRHQARWNDELSRIEMHLESLAEQTVPIRSLGVDVRFAAGETIHTESSYKFDLGQVEEMAAASGFAVRRTWLDVRGWFVSSLIGAV